MKKVILAILAILVAAAVFVGGWKLRTNILYNQGEGYLYSRSITLAKESFTKVSNSPLIFGEKVTAANEKLDEIDTYTKGFTHLNKEEFAEAVIGFQEYEKLYPESPLTIYTTEKRKEAIGLWTETKSYSRDSQSPDEFKKAFEVLLPVFEGEAFSQQYKRATFPLLIEVYEGFQKTMQNSDYPQFIKNSKKVWEISLKMGQADQVESCVEDVKSFTYALIKYEKDKNNDFDAAIRISEEYMQWLEENVPDSLPSATYRHFELLIEAANRNTSGEERIEVYQYVLEHRDETSIPSADFFKETEEDLGLLYANQANRYIRTGKIDEAMAYYRILIEDYEEVFKDNVSQQAVEPLLNYIMEEDWPVKTKISILHTLLENSDLTNEELRFKLHYGLGMLYFDQGASVHKYYLEAITQFLRAKELATNEEAVAEIDAVFVKINEEIGILSDPVGDLVISAVKKVIKYSDGVEFPICDDKSDLCITEEQFAIVRASLGTNPEVKKVAFSYSGTSELRAEAPSEVHFYVENTTPKTTIQTCRYGDTGGYELLRKRVDAVMKIFDIQTGRLISSKTIVGDAPPVCGSKHTFSGLKDSVEGETPDKEPLYDWLRTFLD